MSNKFEREIKNKHILVDGAFMTSGMASPTSTTFEVIVSNDSIGKTISINNGEMQFTIPFEPIEQYLNSPIGFSAISSVIKDNVY